MMQATALPSVQLSRFGWRDLGLWAGAAALVLGAHVAVAYAVQNFTMVTEADGGLPPAQVIEMAPMVVMPAVEEQIAALDAVTPDQTEPTPTPEPTHEEPVEKAEPVVEQPQAVPPDEAEFTRTEMAEQVDQPPPDEVVPDIVEAVAPEVVIPLPQPKPVEVVKDKKPVEAKAKKPVEKPKPRPKKEKAAPPKTVAAASADARPAARTAAPESAQSASRSGDSSKWDSRLGAWIKRHTRYPRSAKARGVEGRPYVAFTVDSSGRVLSARLSRSSGDADLDRAALAVLQGASVPAPPPELGSRLSRTAPFVFSLRN
ncbi:MULTISPECIES: energy transducer TonB [unclassified Mesorhizobium]|jgi:periplasmic protein TonB|uniref:energy transducer TonB family protein n=1 Tax=unclassified Mesorhizobium TaxID=325217 RepID=UPI000FCAA9AA|nr:MULTISPECIES: energy transducer TonB [unclassified Mesorhizobium]RUX91656.1 TonB family protein [Mesorhizobium sp. M7D.F.Ca.US.004.01.2.1]RVA36341.1 TonB family protein [Mesorhizobium sp. M7D.F.Ca.US.004.03.1.1]